MRDGTAFFRKVNGVTKKGFTVAEERATYITRNTSTSFNEVMELSFEQIERLYDSLVALVELENEQIEESLKAKDGS